MESKPQASRLEILENIPISKDCRALTLKSREIAAQAKPGQFLMIRVSPTADPLLPRPFSFCEIKPAQNTVTVVYKMGGPGTTWLSGRKRQETLPVLGPLGRPFQVPPDAKNIVLIGGGVGVTPLISLGEKTKNPKKTIWFFLGLRCKDSNPVSEKMLAFVPETHRYYSTDDGSLGEKGHIIAGLTNFLKTKSVDYIAACGPKAMLKALQNLVVPLGIKTEVAVEQFMACGLGYCQGCAVSIQENGARKIRLACSDGPVMPLDTLMI